MTFVRASHRSRPRILPWGRGLFLSRPVGASRGLRDGLVPRGGGFVIGQTIARMAPRVSSAPSSGMCSLSRRVVVESHAPSDLDRARAKVLVGVLSVMIGMPAAAVPWPTGISAEFCRRWGRSVHPKWCTATRAHRPDWFRGGFVGRDISRALRVRVIFTSSSFFDIGVVAPSAQGYLKCTCDRRLPLDSTSRSEIGGLKMRGPS